MRVASKAGRAGVNMSEATKLHAWNRSALDAAIDAILPCNGSRAWAAAMAERRPFAEPQELFAVADDIWQTLRAAEWQEAFDSHPASEKHTRRVPLHRVCNGAVGSRARQRQMR